MLSQFHPMHSVNTNLPPDNSRYYDTYNEICKCGVQKLDFNLKLGQERIPSVCGFMCIYTINAHTFNRTSPRS